MCGTVRKQGTTFHKVVVAGGLNGDGYQSVVEIYDTEKDLWKMGEAGVFCTHLQAMSSLVAYLFVQETRSNIFFRKPAPLWSTSICRIRSNSRQRDDCDRWYQGEHLAVFELAHNHKLISCFEHFRMPGWLEWLSTLWEERDGRLDRTVDPSPTKSTSMLQRTIYFFKHWQILYKQ